MKKILLLTASMLLATAVSFGQSGENKKRSFEHLRKHAHSYGYSNDNQSQSFKSSFEIKQSLDSVIVKEWDEQEDQMFVYGKIFLSYDAEENIIEELMYEWEEAQLIIVKLQYDYAANGNLTQILYYWYYDDQWEFVGKDEFTYSENGDTTQVEMLSYPEDQWINEFKKQFIYDVDGKKTEEINWSWSYVEAEWMLTDKSEYTYDGEGHLNEELVFYWADYDSLWEKDEKKEFTFDVNGNLLEWIASEWSVIEEDWVFTEKAVYDFANGNFIMEEFFVWDEVAEQFIEDYKYEYAYDSSYTLSELILPPMDWFLLDYTNSFINKPLSRNGYEWNSTNSAWDLDYEEMYYYAEKSISINKIFEGTSGIYPNPFSDFLSFSFSDYDGQKIIFELFDLQGRKLISKTVQEGETINAAELNSGIYFYTLDFDGERKSGKLIKQ